jgi:DNA-binding transcriptional regulator YbjK
MRSDVEYPLSESRADRVADAALRVLGTKGARGLTHRAVDTEAGLVEGSVSNLFRSRVALLAAANSRLAAADLAQVRAMTEAVDGGGVSLNRTVSRKRAAIVLAGLIEHWSSAEETLSVARLELYLEARRQPEFAMELAEARLAFVKLTEELLPWFGCTNPSSHAPSIVALMDGLLFNQLLQPATRLSARTLREALERWLAAC